MKIKKLRKAAGFSKGFTLVELVIVIAIVIILSVVSVPIYRSYVEKAKMSEGYALLGTILSAQKAYYSEYGHFMNRRFGSTVGATNYDTVLGIDARGNKYFTWFEPGPGETGDYLNYFFHSAVKKPTEVILNGKTDLCLAFNITSGVTYYER